MGPDVRLGTASGRFDASEAPECDTSRRLRPIKEAFYVEDNAGVTFEKPGDAVPARVPELPMSHRGDDRVRGLKITGRG